MNIKQKMFSDQIDELLIQLGVSHRADEIIRDTCDCLPIICTEIFSDRERMIDYADAIKELFYLLPNMCSVKELLVTLLLQMDTFKEDLVYFALLPPIGDCIRKLPAKRHLSLGSALETVGAHIETIVVPDESAECVELLPPGVGDVEKRISVTVSALLDFVQPFARNVSLRNSLSARNDHTFFEREATDLTRCLLKVLGGSLAHVNLRSRRSTTIETNENQINECGECAKRCARLLFHIHPDIVKLITDSIAKNSAAERERENLLKLRHQSVDERSASDDDDVDELSHSTNDLMSATGLSVLAYLVFGELVGLERIPQVYSHQFFVHFSLCHVLRLLNYSRSVTSMKGLLLASSLFNRLDPRTLEPRVFELTEITELVEAIVRTMTAARVKEVCQEAVRLLSVVLKAFCSVGRCRFLEFLLSCNTNANVRGHVIVLVKNEIDELLREKCIGSSSSDAARTLLHRLQSKMFRVPREGFRFKLLTDEREQVLSALNLLRYLLIRDRPSENVTGIWNIVGALNDDFLKPLRDGFTLAVCDVRAEMKNLEQSSTVASGQSCSAISFSVDDRTLDDLSSEQRLEMYHMTLVNLDMFDSVLTRVEELARPALKIV